MTKPAKPESAASQLKRLDHAEKLEEVLIAKDELEAVAKADRKIPKKSKD
jgi:hypothetical protein